MYITRDLWNPFIHNYFRHFRCYEKENTWRNSWWARVFFTSRGTVLVLSYRPLFYTYSHKALQRHLYGSNFVGQEGSCSDVSSWNPVNSIEHWVGWEVSGQFLLVIQAEAGYPLFKSICAEPQKSWRADHMKLLYFALRAGTSVCKHPSHGAGNRIKVCQTSQERPGTLVVLNDIEVHYVLSREKWGHEREDTRFKY